MSILPLLLLVGVASSKYIGYHDNDAVLQPIASKSQTRRICAELCLAGLGGEPCGENCLDIVPQALPMQSNTSDRAVGVGTRRDACPVLCENQLGYPLCKCDYVTQRRDSSSSTYYKTDFVQICGFFCIKYNYKIYGCQPCKIYKDVAKKNNGANADMFDVKKKAAVRDGVNWEEWCREMCSIGDGGAACNCDILPMKIPANAI